MYPKAYIQYLVHFHADRDYFECHELLEEHWKEDPRGKRKRHWAGLIQIAVSLYHHRRQNFKGAERMMKHAIANLESEKKAIQQLGLSYEQLLQMLHTYVTAIQSHSAYVSIHLPIIDPHLEQLCLKECQQQGLQWKSTSNFLHEHLIHKHMLRDRSDVIHERLQQMEKRRQRP
ncbi:DUF309 domain-containing protein [Microbacteriaceae bacterium 4G12]